MDSNDCLDFVQKDMLPFSFLAFEDMRQKDELTDFKFIFGNRSFVGHRLVLAAAIPRFRDLFTSAEEEVHGFLRETDEDTFESILSFAYSGKIKVTRGNARSLLSASKFLQLSQVHDACWKFLEKGLDVNNVWEIRELAASHNRAKLVDISDKYIRQNFDTFSKSPSFLGLPFSYLKKVVRRNDVKVVTEEIIFEAVISWVKAVPSRRESHLGELLSYVRLCYVSPDYLIERISKEELLLASSRCQDIIKEAKLYHFSPKLSFHLRKLNTAKRQFYEEKSQIWEMYAFYETSSGLNVKSLDAINAKWTDLSRAGYEGVCHVAALNKIIYIFLENAVVTFDVQMLKWHPLNLKNEAFYESGCVSHKDEIYFFGGEAINSSSNEFRYFNPQENKWLRGGKMSRSLEFPGVASLAEHIYITGGEFKDYFYDNTERYNSITKEFTEISPMTYKRSQHGCASMHGKIYACGGFNGSFVNSAEFFDASTDIWTLIPSMKSPNTSISLISHKNKIYAIGLMETQDCNAAAEIEIYDPESDEWKSGCPLPDDSEDCDIYLASVAKDQRKKRLVKVLHPYIPANDDELLLEIDDVIEVIDDSPLLDVGWWEGILKGNLGLFPSNYVVEYYGSPSVGTKSLGAKTKNTKRKKKKNYL